MSVLNAEQAREVTRNQKTQTYFLENKSTYTLLKPMDKQVNLLILNNEKIASLIPVKGDHGEAATTDKHTLKLIIAQSGGAICSYASDYALETGNATLLNAVHYTTASLSALRDPEVFGVITGIVDVVTPLLSEVGFTEYPVTAEDLQKLKGNAALYNNNLGKAGIIDTNSSIASHDIDAILKIIRGIIIRLSKQVVFFQDKYPGFVKGYHKVILIDYSNIHHSGVRGIITNSITDQPVENVTVTLMGKQSTKTTLTSEEGSYEIIKFRQGKCRLTVSAPGFEEQVVSITIIRGRILEFNISLIAQIAQFKTA